VQRFENIPYVSGGVGVEERDRLKSMATDDNLALSFALENGHYLGGAEVSIKDDKGKELLVANSEAPLFFAKLPVGHYVIEATAMGKTITRAVHVSANGQARIFFACAGSDRDRDGLIDEALTLGIGIGRSASYSVIVAMTWSSPLIAKRLATARRRVRI
jgi:hypothetical protein